MADTARPAAVIGSRRFMKRSAWKETGTAQETPDPAVNEATSGLQFVLMLHSRIDLIRSAYSDAFACMSPAAIGQFTVDTKHNEALHLGPNRDLFDDPAVPGFSRVFRNVRACILAEVGAARLNLSHSAAFALADRVVVVSRVFGLRCRDVARARVGPYVICVRCDPVANGFLLRIAMGAGAECGAHCGADNRRSLQPSRYAISHRRRRA